MIVRLLVVLAILGIVGGALAGCAYEDRAAAERAREEAAAERAAERAALAEAEIERARGEADAQRIDAEAEADAERAASRQMERDAAHARTMATLPYVVAIGGGVVILALAGLVFWDLRRQPAAVPTSTADPAILLLLEQARRAELGQRELWRAIVQLDRRAPAELPGGDRGQVVIYSERGQR